MHRRRARGNMATRGLATRGLATRGLATPGQVGAISPRARGNPLRPTHLSRIRIEGADPWDLALLHAEWALGLGRFETLREARLAAGLPPDATAEELAGDRLRISIPEPGGTTRVDVVKLTTTSDPAAVLVEHLIARSGPERLLARATADSPEVVRHLLRLPGCVHGVDAIGGEARILDQPDVVALVDRVLAPDRCVPLVLVSVDNATRRPLVDPDELARRLAGMASVGFLQSVAASRALKEELVARGFDARYGCYNGGVRILWPGIAPSDDPYDHLLLLPVRLLGIPEAARTEHVAGVFCEMIAEGEDPRAWMRDVDGAAAPPREPVRREPVRREPLRAEPLRAEPLRAEPLRAEPVGAEPLGAEPLRAEPLGAEPLRAEPLRAEPLRAEPVGAEPVGAEPVGAEPLRAEPVRAEPVRAEPVRAEPVRAEPVREQASRDEALIAEPSPPEPSPPEPSPPEPSPPEPSPPEPSPPAEPPLPAPQPASPIAPDPAPDGPTAAPRRAVIARAGAEHWTQLAGDVVAAFELAAELEHDLDTTRRELVSTRKALRRAEQERDEAHASGGRPQSVAAALATAEALFPDRLVVLRSARGAAEDSPFKHPLRVFEVLTMLAMFGRSDAELAPALAKALGQIAQWRPKDSPETVTTFGDKRTWFDEAGEAKLYGRHVTIGGSVNASRCLQIYYDVLSDGRVEIAWCGEHRPTVGKDT